MTEASRGGTPPAGAHGSLFGAVAARRLLDQSALVGPSPAIKGDLIDRTRIRRVTDTLAGYAALAQKAGSYRELLNGESSITAPLPGQGSIQARRILHEMDMSEGGDRGLGGALAGADYESLARLHPMDRFKFYSSLDLTSPDKVALGDAWFREVAQAAHGLGISLTTKRFDHACDSLNLYTWHPKPLAEILRELYPKYQALGLYSATPHLLQGELEGVNPDHIGWVQEPVSGTGIGSHSVRIGRLGAQLDAFIGAGGQITPDAVIQAAATVGVDPARPYLLANG